MSGRQYHRQLILTRIGGNRMRSPFLNGEDGGVTGLIAVDVEGT